jgi:DNA-binding LacI/PurR family transcriptional regulator
MLSSNVKIGIVPPSVSENLVSIPYCQGCLNGLMNEAARHKVDLSLILASDQSDDPNVVLERLVSGQYDGAILMAPPSNGELLQLCRKSGLPITVLSMNFPNTVCVTVDNTTGSTLAVDHLVSLGHTKIAHIEGDPDSTDSIERKVAFLNRMAHHGLSVPPDYIQTGRFIIPDGTIAMQRLIWLNERPTAIFCSNDVSAVGAIQAAWENGLRVPSDMSIVGFDDSLLCAATIPTITSVRQPWIEMGSAALSLLLDQMSGRPAQSRIFPSELIVRNSTSRPGEDHLISM